MLFMSKDIGVTAVAMKSKIVKLTIKVKKCSGGLFIINKPTHIFCAEVLVCKSLVDAIYFAVLPSTNAVLPIQSAVLPIQSAVLMIQSTVLMIQSAVLIGTSVVLPIQSTVLPSTSAVIPPKKRKNGLKWRVLEFYL